VWRRRTEKVSGIPTWSWAATKVRDEKEGIYSGTKVQWSIELGNVESTSIGKFLGAHGVPVEKASGTGDVWETNLERAGEEERYDYSQRFHILTVGGYLQEVQVHDYFDDVDDLKVAARMTSHQPDFGRETWRKVTIAEIPQYVTGWASIERLDY
jgi:hypothetical protein